MTLSYVEMKLLEKMVWMAIKNGNNVELEAFDPEPEEYKMLCEIANRLEENIGRMREMYHLD
mgnify:CR=1 FL=1